MQPKLRAGDLRDVVAVYLPITTKGSAYGDDVISYSGTVTDTVRGKLEYMAIARQFIVAGVTKDATARVLIRWNTNFLTNAEYLKAKIVIGGINWYVVTVTPVDHNASAYIWLRQVA